MTADVFHTSSDCQYKHSTAQSNNSAGLAQPDWTGRLAPSELTPFIDQRTCQSTVRRMHGSAERLMAAGNTERVETSISIFWTGSIEATMILGKGVLSETIYADDYNYWN